MRIVATHTDFRLYWPARLAALRVFAQTQNSDLRVVEIAGKGSPYAFSGVHHRPDGWQCLFPDTAMEDLSPRQAAQVLQNQLDKLQPDVVIAGAIAFPSGAATVRWCTKHGKGCVIFDDARRKDVPRSFPTNIVKRLLYRHVDAMLISAESHVSDYEWWGIPRTRLFFGVDAVDNDFFQDRADRIRKDYDRKRRELRILGPYFLGVGRLVDKKNWATLIRAFAQWQSDGQAEPWSLVLAGDGPGRTALEALIPAVIRDRVHFVGNKTQEELCAYYALAGALVLPSRYGETWGLVVNEAMASGLPVIVSNECGCAETLVHDGINGWLFDPGSTAGLVDKLSLMARQREEARKNMGRASQTIVANWGLERFVSGAWQAVLTAFRTTKRHAPMIDRMMLGLWKGRYRPA